MVQTIHINLDKWTIYKGKNAAKNVTLQCQYKTG